MFGSRGGIDAYNMITQFRVDREGFGASLASKANRRSYRGANLPCVTYAKRVGEISTRLVSNYSSGGRRQSRPYTTHTSTHYDRTPCTRLYRNRILEALCRYYLRTIHYIGASPMDSIKRALCVARLGQARLPSKGSERSYAYRAN